MTQMQVAYWTLQEEKRANQAKEQELHRSNVTKETETQRANLANESLTRERNRFQNIKDLSSAIDTGVKTIKNVVGISDVTGNLKSIIPLL